MYEKVNPSHPDKLADRIAGAVVDLCYSLSSNPKVACEVLIGHGECNVQVETSEQITPRDIDSIVSRIAGCGFSTYAMIVNQDVNLACNQQDKVRCGDNGIFRGMPVTHEQQLLANIASVIYDRYNSDGKYLISRPKVDDGSANGYILTICQSNAMEANIRKLLNDFEIAEYGGSDRRSELRSFYINPLGPWTGGPNVDSGATNRKLGSDMGDAVTGGGLCGKDLSKADVSVNIWCHLEAQRTGKPLEAICSIGDEVVNGIPYEEIVQAAHDYIFNICGGFEKFAEWGLIRPEYED